MPGRALKCVLSAVLCLPLLSCNKLESLGLSPPAKTSGQISALALSGPTRLLAGNCAPYTVSAVGGLGKPQLPTAATQVAVSQNAKGAFYSDPSCSVVLTSLSLSATNSVNTVYYMDASVESPTLTVSATALKSSSLNVQLVTSEAGVLAFVA